LGLRPRTRLAGVTPCPRAGTERRCLGAAAFAPAVHLSRRAGCALARATRRRCPRNSEYSDRLEKSWYRRRAGRLLLHLARARRLSRREGDALRRRTASAAWVALVGGVD